MRLTVACGRIGRRFVAALAHDRLCAIDPDAIAWREYAASVRRDPARGGAGRERERGPA